MTTHPNEPLLVRRGTSGLVIPTAQYETFMRHAIHLGGAHIDALFTQVARQRTALSQERAA